MRRVLTIALLAGLPLLAGCGSTGPSPSNVTGQRARWAAFHLTSYSYVYEQTGGFLSTLTGHPVRVTVRGDTVQAVADAITGDTVPWPAVSFPTIDQLFDRAEAADQAGQLLAIHYHPTYGYPTQMDLGGPPDANGSILASDLSAPGSACALSGDWGWEMNFNPGGSYLNLQLEAAGDTVTGAGAARGIGPNGTIDSITIAGHWLETLAPPAMISMTLTYKSGRIVHYVATQQCPDGLSGTASEAGQADYTLVLIRGKTVGAPRP